MRLLHLALVAAALASTVACSPGSSRPVDSATPPYDSGTSSSVLCSDGVTRTLTEFAVQPGSGVVGIVAASNGDLYFTEYNRQTIGRITQAGLITEFPLAVQGNTPATHDIYPYNIVAAGNGEGFWFTDYGIQGIGYLTKEGAFSETAISGDASFGIAAARDGTVWFAEYSGKIGKISTAGELVEISTPNVRVSSPIIYGITIGVDGDIWYTSRDRNSIGRLSATTGDISEFPLPTPDSKPTDIATGPDGGIWFVEFASNRIGRIAPTGELSEFQIPVPKSCPGGILPDADGTVWFSETNIHRAAIGWQTPDGVVFDCPLPRADSDPRAMVIGPDGSLWFAEASGAIGRLSL